MDRIWARTEGTGDLRCSPADVFALPSRNEAILALRPPLESQSGPVLLTGEAGVGKTWLWRRQAALPLPWRWVSVDVPPALDPTALHGLIGYGLGLSAASFESRPRLALSDFLREASAEGARWALVLDEAHNASALVLEEVRLLANRLGRPDGLAALLLVGQTSLARRLAVRPLRALAVRLTAHVHLRSLDVEEARALVQHLVPGLDWDDPTLERQHRDSGGNPRRMILTARRCDNPIARKPAPQPQVEPIPGPSVTSPVVDEWETPIVGPVKPPLMVGDGMIEVGWEAGLEPETQSAAATPLATSSKETSVGPEIETVNDHYAALQAWNEWARNQGRGGVDTRLDGLPAELDAEADPEANPDEGPGPGPGSAPAGHPSVWREGQQGFAPYGQLFSRLRQVRDVNESS